MSKTAIIKDITYNVTMPHHSQDMNFHFVNKGVDHLVDLHDVINWKYRQFEDTDDVAGKYQASIDDAIEYANNCADMAVGFWWTTKEIS